MPGAAAGAAGAAATRPTAAAAVSAPSAKPPVTNRFRLLGAEFKSVGGGKYTVEKSGTMLQPQLEHLAGILSQMDMTNNKLFVTSVENQTAYITIRNKGTKQFVAAFPLEAGRTLIPQPKTNDPVDLAKWADQEKAAKQGRTPQAGTTNYKDPSGRITLYRRYKNLLFPPRGILWTRRQLAEAQLLEAAGSITVLGDSRRQGESGKIYAPEPRSFNLYTKDAGVPEPRAPAPLPAPVPVSRVATLRQPTRPAVVRPTVVRPVPVRPAPAAAAAAAPAPALPTPPISAPPAIPGREQMLAGRLRLAENVATRAKQKSPTLELKVRGLAKK